MLLLLSDFFSKLTLSKNLPGTLSECPPVSIQIRTRVLSFLIWVQTVCKDYQQMTKVAKMKLISTCMGFHMSPELRKDMKCKLFKPRLTLFILMEFSIYQYGKNGLVHFVF